MALGTFPTVGERRVLGASPVLPAVALDIIQARPRFASSSYVFAGHDLYIKGFAKLKRALDAKVPISTLAVPRPSPHCPQSYEFVQAFDQTLLSAFSVMPFGASKAPMTGIATVRKTPMP